MLIPRRRAVQSRPDGGKAPQLLLLTKGTGRGRPRRGVRLTGSILPIGLIHHRRSPRSRSDCPAPDQTRNLSPDDSADQVAEDQIGLDRGQRRDVQRRLDKLGFDIHVNGKFDDETRGVIKRWQAVQGYPATGFLNKEQHDVLVSQNLASRAPSDDEDSSSSSDESSHSHHYRHSGGGGRRYYHGGGGGPGAFFGHMMGGLFR